MKLLIIFLLLCSGMAFGQISGSSAVNAWDTVQYSFYNGSSYSSINWQTAHGSVYLTWNSGTTYYAKVIWHTGGTASLTALSPSYQGLGNKSVTVTGAAPPTGFTFLQQCNSTIITRTKNPPPGVTWYWQTSGSGTSTTNSGPTYTVTNSQVYYLRSYSNSTWNTLSASTPSLTILTPPAAPSVVHGELISNSASSVSASVTPVAGLTYKWYTLIGDVTPLVTQTYYATTVQSNSTKVLYVSSNNAACTSATRSAVNFTIYPEPIVTISNDGDVQQGGSIVMTVTNPIYSTYTWFDKNMVAIPGQTGTSFTTAIFQEYYLQVKKGNSQVFTAGPFRVFSQNYIVTTDVLVDGINSESQVRVLPIGERSQSTTFFDGIGRPVQSVTKRASAGGFDVIQPLAYDDFGREAKKYRPFTKDTIGWFRPAALQHPQSLAYQGGEQFAFYQVGGKVAKDSVPYAETRFEVSPLARTKEQGSPGKTWQPDSNDSYSSTDRTVKFDYGTNDSNEVTKWIYTPPVASTSPNVVNGGYYPANILSRTKTKDEQGSEVMEYRNSENQIVLKKVKAPGGLWAETYYIYDVRGRLLLVLPPEAVVSLNTY